MIFKNCNCHIGVCADMTSVLKALKNQKRANSLTVLFMGLTSVYMILSEVRSCETAEQVKYLNREIERLKERKEE